MCHVEASKQILGPQFSSFFASQFTEADCIYSSDLQLSICESTN